MSNYIFSPSPGRPNNDEPFATWVGGFTSAQVDAIVGMCEKLPNEKGIIGGEIPGKTLGEIRESQVSWLECNNDSLWVYDQLAFIARKLNGQFYNLDLYGFSEHMQYTVYHGDLQSHYTWHQDTAPSGDTAPRKLSMVLQLTDPDEYQGGELELYCGPEPVRVTKQKGLVAVFPAHRLHRVTPVTRGIRRSLVVWVCGPAFR